MGNVHSASSCGRPDTAKELLRAAEAGDVQAITSMLQADSRLLFHYSVFGGNSVWHKASKGGHAAVLEALEQAVKQQYEHDNKDLHEVLRPSIMRLGASAADVVTRLINKANVKGFTPLMLACSGNHTEAVAFLVKRGADVWKHDRVRRHTALHCAAEIGATDAIRLLLARTGHEQHPGNNRTLLEQGNHAGLTALHYAVYCEQHEVVAQLVAQDADITAQAEFPDLDWGCINAGDTPMHIAAHKGNIDAIQIMLKAYNEKSGAFMPSQDGSRRLRDPRAMRNDYGRLPFHLAMRKGLTWLGEMLDPSVPVRFLLTDDQLDSNTLWGPPRLATIAAAVLHRSLVADLKAIQAEQQQQPGSGDAAEAGASQPPVAQPQPVAVAPRVTPLRVSPVGGSSNDSTTSSSATGRRRWGRHRRANSDAARWASRITESSPRPSSTVRRLSTGGLGRISRRGRTASPSSAAGASASAGGAGGERTNLQEALGQLSPRALVAALVGSGGEDAAGSSSVMAAALAVYGPDASPSTGSTWRRLVARQGLRLGGSSKGAQQQQQPSCASPDPEDCCPQQGGSSEAQPGDAKAPEGRTLQRSASDSFCLVLGDAELEVCCVEGDKREQQEAKEPDGIRAVFDSGKVSPFPELKPDMADGVLDNLLEQYMAELRGSTTATPCQQQQQFDSNSSEDGQACGVCLDAAPSAMIVPCEHTMCAECALDMCERCPLGTAMCPFCRCIIKSFVPVSSSKPPVSSTNAAPAATLHMARPGVALAPLALPVC